MELIILDFLDKNRTLLKAKIEEYTQNTNDCFFIYSKRLNHLKRINKIDDLRYIQVNELISNLKNYNKNILYCYSFSIKNSNIDKLVFIDEKKERILGVFEFDKW